MAFTSGNDINILQGTDTAIVGAGAGDDIYIVSPVTLTAGQVIDVSDAQGTNTLQLIGGLTIASSVVVSNALQLTLSNGAVINVNGADTFNFNVGGNAITGDAGVDKDFETFAEEDLGVTVPAEGEPSVAGGPVEIGAETGEFTLTADADAVDEGATAAFTVENGESNFTYSYEISGVDADDVDGDLTGTVTTDADGNASIGVALAADRTTEGEETLTVSLTNTGKEASVIVNDVSLDNVAPVAEDAAVEVAEADAAVAGQLAATDAEDDALTFTLDAPVDGLTLNADGSYTFDPAANPAAQALTYADDNLVIAAAYTVTDALGATDQKTLTITVTPTPLTFELTTGVSSVEESVTQIFTVEASEALAVDTDVTFTLLPGDGTAANAGTNDTNTADFDTGAFNPQTVTIAAGETTAEFEVVPSSDATTELPESFTVQAEVEGVADPFTIEGTVVDATTPGAAGQTFILTTGVDTIPGLIGSENSAGTNGDDTIIGVLGDTLSPLDSIDAGLGENTMRIDDLTGGELIPGSAVINNVQIVNLRSDGDVGTAADPFDASDIGGLETLNVTVGEDIYVEAADTTAINVSGAAGGDGGLTTGLIQVDGGSSQTVTVDDIDYDVTLGGTTPTEGAVSVTHSDQGAGVITIDGGSTVDVTATSETSTGDIIIGGTTASTDAVTVTQNLNSDGSAALDGGAIDVTGGTTVDVTVNATSDAADEDSDDDITVGAVTVTGGDDTTEVTVVQNDSVTTFTDPGEAMVPATSVLTFDALDSGETTIVEGLTFTASRDLTAAEVAQAFAGLTDSDTQDAGGPTANGFYTGALTAGWTSGEADGASVTFTADADNPGLMTVDTGDIDPTQVYTAGTAVVPSDTSTNDVTLGGVTIADGGDDSLATVTVDGYGVSTVASDALATLSLANSAGTMDVTTNSDTLELNVNNVNDNVDLDGVAGAVTNLTLNTQDNWSSFALTATGVSALTINTSGGGVDLGGSTFTALETIDVNGDSGVDLGDISGETNLTSFDASDNTGYTDALIDANSANIAGLDEYIFSQGDDYVDVLDDTIDIAITLNDGDDWLTLNPDSTVVPTAAVDGGDGDDLLTMTIASAAAYDDSTVFASMVTNFEMLEISDVVGAPTVIDLANLGYDYVITNGSTDLLVLDNMANGGTVDLNGDGLIQVNVTDADTGDADVLNVLLGDWNDNGPDIGSTLTVSDVETLNFDVDSDTVLDVAADSVTTINVTGGYDFELTDLTASMDNLTLLDASGGYSGDLIAGTNGVSAQTILGGSGDDVLTVNGSLQDTLDGGAGADTLIAGAGRASLTGGDGIDTFVLDTASINLNAAATIEDAETGDVIELTGALNFESAAIDLDPSGDPNLQDYADAAMNSLDTTTAGGSLAGWFEYNENTYVVVDVDAGGQDSTVFEEGEDYIIKIAGIVDLSTASFNTTDATLEFA